MRGNGLQWSIFGSLLVHAVLLVVLIWRAEEPEAHGVNVDAVTVELVPAVQVPAAPEPPQLEEPVGTSSEPHEEELPQAATTPIEVPDEPVEELPPTFFPVNPNLGPATTAWSEYQAPTDDGAEPSDATGDGAEPESTSGAEAEAAEASAEAQEVEEVEAREEPEELVAAAADTPVNASPPDGEQEPQPDAPLNETPDTFEAEAPEEETVAEPSVNPGNAEPDTQDPQGEAESPTEEELAEEDTEGAEDDILLSLAPATDQIAVPRRRPPAPPQSASGAPAISWATALAPTPEASRSDDDAVGYNQGLRSAVAPMWFSLMANISASGTVQIELRIAPNGELLSAEMIQSSGNFDMDRAAMETVRRTRFDPLPPSMGGQNYRVILPLRAF